MRRLHYSWIRFALLWPLAMGQLLQGADAPKIDRLVPGGGQRGTTVEVKLPGKPGDGGLKTWSNRDQLQLELSEKMDSAKLTIPQDARVGRHWLRFHNEHGATELLPFIVGHLAELAEAEPNNKLAESQTVESLPVTANGVLEKSGDADLYAVTLKQSDTFIASIDANRLLGSPMDAVLQLLDSAGTVVSQNDDNHGFDPQIVFEVPHDGTYHVRTFAFPAAPNSTIKLAGAASYVYRLTLTTGPFADHCVPAQVASTGQSSVHLHGWNLNSKQSAVKIPPFEGPSVVVGESVALPVVVTAADFPTLVEAENGPQDLPIPASVTGLISQPDEKDIYTFQGKKDQKLTLSVAAQSLNSPLDPSLSVDITSGKRVKGADDRSRDDRDAEVSIKLSQDGQYTITVEDLFGNGGQRFLYVLSVIETQPDFKLTLKNNSFVVPLDKELEIPMGIARTNGFADTIAVTVDGLPEGVTADAVSSEGKGESAKNITLKVKREKTSPGFSGIVSVIGTHADSNKTHVAESPIRNSTATTKDIWLTVLGSPVPKEKVKQDKPAEKAKP